MTTLVVLLMSVSLGHTNATPQAAPAAQRVLDRYTAYRKANPSIRLDWTVDSKHGRLASGELIVDGTRRMKAVAYAKGESYILSESERGVVEIHPSTMSYDEWPALNGVGTFDSRLTGLSQLVPSAPLRMRVDDPRNRTPFMYLGQTTVDGDVTDRVGWTVTSQEGTASYELDIDAKGLIRRFEHSPPKMGGGRSPKGAPQRMGARGRPMPSSRPPTPAGSDSTPDDPTKFDATGIAWYFQNYRAVKLTADNFEVQIPSGYAPYAIPASTNLKIEVDHKLPDVAWMRDSTPFAPASLYAHGPGLLVVMKPDCIPSRILLADMPQIIKKFSGLHLSIQTATFATNPQQAHGALYEPTGQAIKKFGDAATPLIVLVDPKGKITNLWTGYDHADAEKFADEIAKAVAAQSADPTRTR